MGDNGEHLGNETGTEPDEPLQEASAITQILPHAYYSPGHKTFTQYA